MHGVVILHPSVDQGQRCRGVGDRAESDVIAFEGFDEGLGHAIRVAGSPRVAEAKSHCPLRVRRRWPRAQGLRIAARGIATHSGQVDAATQRPAGQFYSAPR